MTDLSPRDHWERIHATKDVDAVSWWQSSDTLWLDLFEDLDLPPEAPIVDIGSGSSLLIESLLARGHTRLVAVDISPAALARIRERVGDRPELTLVAVDARHFRADEPVAVWHDRAVFHFLIDEADRSAYVESLRASLAPGGQVIVATFAPDGPESCSGLPVRRYDAEGLARALGFPVECIRRSERRVHVTPWGTEQPFTVVVLADDQTDPSPT